MINYIFCHFSLVPLLARAIVKSAENVPQRGEKLKLYSEK